MKLILIKINILVIFLNNIVKNIHYYLPKALSIRSLRNTQIGKNCIVLGNGPSLTENIDIFKHLVKKMNLKLIAVNRYPLTTLAKEYPPDYLVLSDIDSRPDKICKSNVELWNWIGNNPNTNIVLPSDWQSFLDGNSNIQNNIFYFCNLSLLGWTKNINPTLPKGYVSLTAYTGLSIANYMGFKNIYILGIDNNQFKNIQVNEDNQIILDFQYFDNKSRWDDVYFDKLYKNGISDFMYSVSLSFSELRKCFGKLNIINLDKKSILDMFSKISSID